MQIPFEEILRALVAECYEKRNQVFVAFAFISLAFLIVGSIWPKQYTATTTILIDDSNILQPLMRGAAETTRPVDHVANAREMIFGEKIMDKILLETGWLENEPSEIEQEKIKQNIKEHVIIDDIGDDMIKMEYRDKDPMRAYLTAKTMVDLFIEEGETAKTRESESAYEFIEQQVAEYLEKLSKVEDDLRRFHSNNPDARPELVTEVTSRISRLSSEIEQTELKLRETLIRKNSIQDQLSGEAAITISQSREGQYRGRIAELQSQLESLRLDYKETYPDIIRIKNQIEDLKEAMNQEIAQREEARKTARRTGKTYIDEGIRLNPLYQQLRSELSTTETQIATLKTRISEMKKILEKEYERARIIHGGEATLAQLTRNYKVNQDIYQDLLRRLESARVSRSLDREQRGLTYRIQEPAKIPLLPTGIRFIHFALAGLIVGITVPVGFIYFLIQVDPRVRFSRIIAAELDLQVVAEITRLSSVSEQQQEKANINMLLIGTAIIFIIYGFVGWLKFTGQL